MTNWYAVRVGKHGPNIYEDWATCSQNVTGYSGSVYKSFKNYNDAHNWINSVETSNTFESNGCNRKCTKFEMPGAFDAEDFYPDDVFDDIEFDLLDMPPVTNHSTSTTPTMQDEKPEIIHSTFSPSTSDFELSTTQLEVINRVIKKENVFFTGSAGTGKSVLLRAIIDLFGGCVSSELAITASTGIASVNIGGTTIHSFAGIGLGKEHTSKLLKDIITRPAARDRWKKVEVLIIDEISMIDGSLFDKLEYIARMVRNKKEPFGGIQLIVCGDFCQLPPVPDLHDGVPVPVTFAFDAKSWKDCLGQPIILRKVFRQKEQKFIDILNDMRFGRLNEETVTEFRKLQRVVHYADGIAPTELYPMRYDVEKANIGRLISLPGFAHTYKSWDRPGIDIRGKPIAEYQAERLLERLVAWKEITLKVGAQVMLIKNLVQGHLVNGSVGLVIDFKTPEKARETRLEIMQVDAADKTSTFSHEGKREKVNKVNDELINGVVWPVVRFSSGRELLCVPASFSVVNVMGRTEATRDQIPLILAWALSVHKSQGQTLERVKVDLGRTFESGQAYVALSRATNLETLQVLNFDASKVMAHPRVIQWYNDIEQQQTVQLENKTFYDEMDNEEAAMAYFTD